MKSTSELVAERLRIHRFAFSLFRSVWEHLEGSVWLFRVAELLSYDFQTIVHFADVAAANKHVAQSLRPGVISATFCGNK